MIVAAGSAAHPGNYTRARDEGHRSDRSPDWSGTRARRCADRRRGVRDVADRARISADLDARDGDRITFRLGNCPYQDVVKENQPVVCALHKGITRGLLDALAPEARVTAFDPNDPDRAGCTIEIQGLERVPTP
jgi:predicted ArsR family transcriptional regulator